MLYLIKTFRADYRDPLLLFVSPHPRIRRFTPSGAPHDQELSIGLGGISGKATCKSGRGVVWTRSGCSQCHRVMTD